ncbi:MAG: hypothetical protein JWN70_95 [Planctomycetaceae bacterium]|nr:hypothetical protein [Planctomycetaceae bacterium]
MRIIPPFTKQTVLSTMFGLVPTIHTDLGKMQATDEHPDEVQACLEFLISKRELWLSLTDEGDLLDDLLLTWKTLHPSQFVERACMLRMIAALLTHPTLRWEIRDARPLPTETVLQMDREAFPFRGGWHLYLETKAWLRDPTVVPEVAATWDVPLDAHLSGINARLPRSLAYSATDAAVALLFDRWTRSVDIGERQAAQLELCLLEVPGISPPKMTDLEIERSGIALLAHSIRLDAVHPVLLRWLQPDNPCHEALRMECMRRPHLRRLCRGPHDWAQNLIRYFATLQNDLPP